MKLSTFLSFILHPCLFAATYGHSDHSDHVMCGTEDATATTLQRIRDITTKKQARSKTGKIANPGAPVTVDTYVCIVTDTQGNGNVADTAVQKQIAFLNSSFSNTVFKFVLKGITRFQLANAMTINAPEYASQIGLGCRRGGLNSLNLFVVPSIGASTGGTVLGMAMPFFTTGANYIDGVFIHTQTLPGGDIGGYNLGAIAVHEIGHWFGLIHTFQTLPQYASDPCSPSNPQDYISDTKQVASASFGCDIGKNSCPNIPGLDPIENFMDYSTDYDTTTGKVCKTSFTRGQATRMEDVWYFYRVQNEICALSELQVNVQLKFDGGPQENSWDIRTSNGVVVHDSTPDGLGVPYAPSFAGQTITISICLPKAKYVFGIYDNQGNGIGSPGYYSLTVDGQLVAKGGQDFTNSKFIGFGGPSPIPVPLIPVVPTNAPQQAPPPTRPAPIATRRPTKKPVSTPSPSPAPTVATEAPTTTTTSGPTVETSSPTVTASPFFSTTSDPTFSSATFSPTISPTVAPTVTLTACTEFPCSSYTEKVRFCHYRSDGSRKNYCLSPDFAYRWLMEHERDYCGRCI